MMKQQRTRSVGKYSKTPRQATHFHTGGAASKLPPSYGMEYVEKSKSIGRMHNSQPGDQRAGLKSSVGENDVLGGRTVGEFIGDVARPVGTAVGNVVGSVVGAATGVNISSTTNSGPVWNNHGHFDWRVGFNTTGRNGWIVQEIINGYRAEDTSGNDVTPAYTPHYWEAWAVDGSGNVTPKVGSDNDYWIRPSRGNNTEGHWSMRAKVYFTSTNPTTQGFTPGGVSDAGILLSTTSAPSGLGIARFHRYAQGTWDSTTSTPTHTGSAGP